MNDPPVPLAEVEDTWKMIYQKSFNSHLVPLVEIKICKARTSTTSRELNMSNASPTRPKVEGNEREVVEEVDTVRNTLDRRMGLGIKDLLMTSIEGMGL